jgi:lipoprotein-anchoring transpeptidase ErfK/SrfK
VVETTTSTSSTTTSTTAAAATSTTAAPLPGLGRGSTGPAVKALEQRLADLHYDAGAVDGMFDAATVHAVTAFQKTVGMDRTGRATDDVVARIAASGDPEPMLGTGGANRVEIDLKRQVLFVWKDGKLLRILPVSTGSGQKYCVDGACAMAVTPGGSFKVGRKIRGLHISPLGQLYNPLFFNGGIAMHGSPSVPTYPASHGCIRVPMNSTVWLFDTVSAGTPVYVVGGPKAPVPFNEQAPPEPGSTTTAPPATTTTTPTTTTAAPATTTTTAAPATTTTIAAPPPTTSTTTIP